MIPSCLYRLAANPSSYFSFQLQNWIPTWVGNEMKRSYWLCKFHVVVEVVCDFSQITDVYPPWSPTLPLSFITGFHYVVPVTYRISLYYNRLRVWCPNWVTWFDLSGTLKSGSSHESILVWLCDLFLLIIHLFSSGSLLMHLSFYLTIRELSFRWMKINSIISK